MMNDETKPSIACCSMMEKMQQCMGRCKLCPLLPIIMGVVLLLLGYALPAATVRIMWMVLSGLMILMGIICLAVTNLLKKRTCCEGDENSK